MKMFVFGAGYTVQHFANRFGKSEWHLHGTTRDAGSYPAIRDAGLEPLIFDGATFTASLNEPLVNATHLLISVAASRDLPNGGAADPVLKAGQETILNQMPNLQWIGYLSTVGVYGNHDGAWIDETTQCKPVSQRSINRFAAETEWQSVAEAKKIPLAILRLSGIYGPGRNIFKTIEEGRSRRMVKQNQVFNRIHVFDIAQAIGSAADKKAYGIFNITDDEPAPPQDVVTFAHGLVGSEPPAEIDFETADITPMARSFYGENKRVSNARSKQILELEYQFPDYKTSLTKMWDERHEQLLF